MRCICGALVALTITARASGARRFSAYAHYTTVRILCTLHINVNENALLENLRFILFIQFITVLLNNNYFIRYTESTLKIIIWFSVNY